MFCKNCGKQLSDNAKFCPACGWKNEAPAGAPAAPAPGTPQQTAPAQPAQGTPGTAAPVPPRPVGAQSATAPVPAKNKPPKKRRVWLIVLLSCLGVAVIGVAAFFVLRGMNGSNAAEQAEEAPSQEEQVPAEANGSTGAMDTMIAILQEADQTADDWLVQVDEWNDMPASLASTSDFYDKLADQQQRMQQIEGLPANVRTACTDFYDLIMSAIEDLYKNMDFLSAFNGLFNVFDENDLVKTYNDFSDQYNSIECPSNLQDSWKNIGHSLDYLATGILRSDDAAQLEDMLRAYSANNHLQRFALVVDNEYKNLGNTVLAELEFANLQIEKADAIESEILALSSLSDEEIQNYEFQYNIKNVLPDPTYEHIETIYPSLYNSYDSFVTVKMGCLQGERDVILECEIPGLSQSMAQSYHIGSALTILNIKPPASSEKLNLDSAKDTQIRVSIKDKNDGSIIDEQSFPVHIASRNDFMWLSDEFGTITQDNILCFLAPDSEAIAELKRNAIDELSSLTGEKMTSFVGYQGPYFLEDNNGDGEADNFEPAAELTTYVQVAALMRAMSNMGVRYTADAFSINHEGQHILFPDQVLERKTGLCIETSLVIASALQSSSMHTFLVLPEGHAQVAVETWEGSGEYFLIETTEVPNEEKDFLDDANFLYNEYNGEHDYNPIMLYTAEGWANYLAQDPENPDDDCYVIDCSDGKVLGLTPFAY